MVPLENYEKTYAVDEIKINQHIDVLVLRLSPYYCIFTSIEVI